MDERPVQQRSIDMVFGARQIVLWFSFSLAMACCLWTRKADAPKLNVPLGFQALDLMGNPVEGRDVVPGETPLYLIGK
jgi:hypothetical protein